MRDMIALGMGEKQSYLSGPLAEYRLLNLGFKLSCSILLWLGCVSSTVARMIRATIFWEP